MCALGERVCVFRCINRAITKKKKKHRWQTLEKPTSFSELVL